MDEDRWDSPQFEVLGICWKCAHYRKHPLFTCDAFPGGVPDDILFGKFDHHDPYPSDGGIQFQSVEVGPEPGEE